MRKKLLVFHDDYSICKSTSFFVAFTFGIIDVHVTPKREENVNVNEISRLVEVYDALTKQWKIKVSVDVILMIFTQMKHNWEQAVKRQHCHTVLLGSTGHAGSFPGPGVARWVMECLS